MKRIKNLYDELNWETATGYSKGTKRKVLRDDDNKGQTILLKLPEGFNMAPHSHITAEQHFVLEGEYQSGGESYPAGSYQIFSSGEEHGPFESKKGALILVVWDPLQVVQ
ncbi:cupin domain-containing protein [Lutibacter sp.]|uniref:cupin domain-containing protein n=1 Tax=Lutibacter sp. TaxID=1925666 RepID=UPI0025C055F4|nr:cupin domain-containing protein [Lutibacter sp.]MCF6181595.1 cupin domain-containing protein [Lutibacter sp.]